MGAPADVAARAVEPIKTSEPYYADVLRQHLNLIVEVLHASDRWPPSFPLLVVAARSNRYETICDLAAGLGDASCIFMALGSIGAEGNLQRVVIEAARRSTALRQFVRLSVLNASPTSLGINQRAHWSIDCAASAAQIPYTTIRPAIFSASLLAGAAEIRARRAWTGIADTGQAGLIDHTDVADVAARILTDPATWETHYDLTGPVLLSWPRALALLSAELNYPISFETLPERQFLTRLIQAGVAPGQAELLIAREWAIQAGENDRLTGTVRELTGHAPRAVEAFLHDNRRQFLQTGPRT